MESTEELDCTNTCAGKDGSNRMAGHEIKRDDAATFNAIVVAALQTSHRNSA
jgi:hypothetical protein